MASQASNYLPIPFILFFLSLSAGAAPLAENELNDAVQKKDWPSVVLLLQPKKGQNFDHDLTLAKALLSLERRQESLKVLTSMLESRKDERALKLLQTAGSIFFSQETSTLYYDAIEFIQHLKFTEAKERLDQGLLKEPGHVLMLTRLVQMELLLNQKAQAITHLKLAQSYTVASPELSLFAAKIAVEKLIEEDADEGSEYELYRSLSPDKNLLMDNQVTLPFWGEALKRAHKVVELEALALRTLKDHALWTYSLQWFRTNAKLSLVTDEKLKTQIEKNLKDKAAFTAALENEMKRSDYLWVGYVNYDALVLQAKPTPTPTPKN